MTVLSASDFPSALVATGRASDRYTAADFVEFAALYARWEANPLDHPARVELLSHCRQGGRWDRSGVKMQRALLAVDVLALTPATLQARADGRGDPLEVAANRMTEVGTWPLGVVFFRDRAWASVAASVGMTWEEFAPMRSMFAAAFAAALVSQVKQAYGFPTSGY